MKRTISVTEIENLIMNVLKSGKSITLYKESSIHSPSFSFAFSVSSCSKTKSGLQFETGNGYINLDFTYSITEESEINYYLRKDNENINGYWMYLGEGIIYLEHTRVNSLLHSPEVDVIEKAIFEGRKL